MDWEFGISRCKLLHLEWISNEILLYCTGKYIQSLLFVFLLLLLLFLGPLPRHMEVPRLGVQSEL